MVYDAIKVSIANPTEEIYILRRNDELYVTNKIKHFGLYGATNDKIIFTFKTHQAKEISNELVIKHNAKTAVDGYIFNCDEFELVENAIALAKKFRNEKIIELTQVILQAAETIKGLANHC